MIDSTHVFRIKKLLYGLIQDPQAWYDKIDRPFVYLGLKLCEFGHSIYLFNVDGNTFIVVVYIYDFILNGINSNPIFRLKHRLSDTFEMIDL